MNTYPYWENGKKMLLLLAGIFFPFSFLFAQWPEGRHSLTVVELNCENLFDTHHEVGKEDGDYTPEGKRHWTRTRFWRKLNQTGQTILSCSEELPDLVALVEVESDSVLHSLTRRSLLRNAGYEYLMTSSPDVRGIDVALLYQPAKFRPICYETLDIPLTRKMRPTRDILYVQGEVITGDTLHLFVVHAPSRFSGERASRPFRMQVARRLVASVDSLFLAHPGAWILVAGDFNDPISSIPMRFIMEHGLQSATNNVRGKHGAVSNYRYQGRWEQIDHVLVSPTLSSHVVESYVNDAPFLLEEDMKYGGVKPFRTYNGYRYQRGFSDHLPLVVRMSF